MKRSKFLSKEKICCLPKTTGVYVFKKERNLLYIGKATNIKERVKSHFQEPTFRDNLFINQVSKIGYIKTDSEIEALILEANLIKKYQPKYNIVWKDNKNYFYVGITKEEFPKIFITHQTKLKIYYVGPFVDGNALKQTLKLLRKVFPYRSCNKIPVHSCLWYHLQRCPAPCLLKSPLSRQIAGFTKLIIEECQNNTKNLIKVLQGKKTRVMMELKKEMKEMSQLRDFEKAAKIRDQIYSLERVMSHAKVLEPLRPSMIKGSAQPHWKFRRIEAYDVSNIQGQQATGSMVTFIDGVPDKNFYRKFKIKISGHPNDVAMIKETLSRRFDHPEWPYPNLMLIDGGKAQLNAAIKTKSEKRKTENIRIMALAKKKNELFIERRKGPILLKTLPREIFNLILQLRDEAHRFARKYHHKLREIDLFPRS